MLEIDNATRRFGDLVALDHLTFSVPPGQVFGFLGPNGAGKTTAMRAIFGVTAPDDGEIRWKGARVGAEQRRRFGYMPEERGLYPGMKVGDQLVYFGRLHGMEAQAARRAAEHWLERLGVVDRIGDKVEALSLGNQQRVQLAAAMVHEPELLVLDEPFSGLGARRGRGRNLLKGSAPGTVLMALLWFLLGYTFYCSLYAAAGSLASRVEDAQNMGFPLQLPLLIGYLASISALTGGGVSPLVTVMAYLPPTAPLAMPTLVAAGKAGALQVVIAVALTLAGAAALMKAAGAVYTRAILRTGRRIKLREVMRAPAA